MLASFCDSKQQEQQQSNKIKRSSISSSIKWRSGHLRATDNSLKRRSGHIKAKGFVKMDGKEDDKLGPGGSKRSSGRNRAPVDKFQPGMEDRDKEMTIALMLLSPSGRGKKTKKDEAEEDDEEKEEEEGKGKEREEEEEREKQKERQREAARRRPRRVEEQQRGEAAE